MRPARRVKWAAGIAVLGVLAALNGPTLFDSAKGAYDDYRADTAGYKADNGHWSTVDVPEDMRVNAIHAALLSTGKVLIIAGSGNDREMFDAGTFKSLLWDPVRNTFREIHTPDDMFCGGHAFLPDGKLLIAGGTRRYEVLPGDIHRAAGVMTVKNESPDAAERLPKGTVFTGPTGVEFRSIEAVTLPRAEKVVRANGKVAVTASSTELWVHAVQAGRGSVVSEHAQYEVGGLTGARSRNVYGLADAMTFNQQDFWGERRSYVFDPATERYERVSDLTLARWYPTLVGLEDGKVLAVSGLDQFGRIIEGDNEIFDPSTRTWTAQPQLQRKFPTYPALFLMPNGNLFYSGGNAGYGPADVGRRPGIWNLEENTFRAVPGLRDTDETETSGSVLLPPAQDQRYMIVGGGGVGDSPRATARTAVVDLRDAEPRYRPGPALGKPTRYPNLVITPDDKVLISGGSSGYRGSSDSDIFECNLYDPKTNTLTRMADSEVGRNYHSEALLLPDGRVLTLGGDPLFGDKANTRPGTFERRLEVYSPPYLYRGNRPTIAGGPTEVGYGESALFTSPQAGGLESARLIRPSAVTHVTDVEQRSIALTMTQRGDGFSVKVPSSRGLVPAGWYLLFVNDAEGTPSVGRWVHVG